MKRLHFLLLIFILFLTPNVFAYEFNMNNYTSATLNGTKNRYQGTEIYEVGGNFTYQFGTRYNGRLSEIETYFSYPFESNTTYRFTYNMATSDFNNNFGSSYWWDCEHDSSSTVFIPTYISYKKIQYSITPSQNTTCIRVSVRGKNLSTGNITQISNWNLSSITLYDPDYQSGSGGGQGSTPSTPDPNQTIIENQNNNTQDIINNNNDNTNNIITSIQETTQQVSDTITNVFGNKCSNLWNVSLRNGPYGFADGYAYQNDDYVSSSNFISVESNTDYYISFNGGNDSSDNGFVFYNNGVYVGEYRSRGLVHIPSNVNQINYNFSLNNQTNNISNIMFVKGSTSKPWCEFDSYTSKIDETTNAINQQNEYLMDNSNPSISDNDFLDTFNSIGLNDPLSYLLTLPTQLINKLVSNSDTCSPINLGTLYGVSLTLPCIDLESILGSTVWGIIDVIFSVSLMAVIFKNLYDTFSNLLTMGAQKEAKEKFSMPTPMDFLSMILGGDR